MLYGKYDGTAADYMGVDHQFVRDQDILFVYSGERMQPDTIKMIRDQLLVKVGAGVRFFCLFVKPAKRCRGVEATICTYDVPVFFPGPAAAAPLVVRIRAKHHA